MLLTVLVIVCVMYLIDDGFGISLLMMVGIACMVSCLMPIIFKNKIDATVSFPKQTMEKGETIVGKIRLKNRVPLPTPWIDLILEEKSQFNMNTPQTIRTMMGPRESLGIDLSYTALTRGVTSIGVEQILFKNPFGFKSVHSMKAYKGLGQLITIMPEIYDISPSHPLIMVSMQPNEEEDTNQGSETRAVPSSEVGFECKYYQEGDALNKIHWKQSSKYNRLMVRENLYVSKGRQQLLLDPKAAIQYGSKEREMIESNLLEAFLSLGNALYQSGAETELCFYLGERWQHYLLNTSEAIKKLQFQMASYPFIELPTNLSARLGEVMEDKRSTHPCPVMLFSLAPSQEIEQAIHFCEMRNIHLIQVDSNRLRGE